MCSKSSGQQSENEIFIYNEKSKWKSKEKNEQKMNE